MHGEQWLTLGPIADGTTETTSLDHCILRCVKAVSRMANRAIKSFARSLKDHIGWLGASCGISPAARLNFVHRRICTGGASPSSRARYTSTQCLLSSKFRNIAELQQAANTRFVTDSVLILWLFRRAAPREHLMRSFR
jgi:hypothetical protein